MIHEGWEQFYMPEPNSGCWIWMGELDSLGYGLRGWGPKAYRFFYEMQNGPIPPGLCVCHSCDVRSCVNPDHMWLGTHAENMADAAKKRRFAPQGGEKNGNSILTESDVSKIRSSTEPHRKLAERFGVAAGYIKIVKSRRRWKEIP